MFMNFKTLFLGCLVSTYSFAVCNQLELDRDLPTTGFRHPSSMAASWFEFHHSASDVITVPTHEATLNAKFSYGPLHKDLEDEDVEIWLDNCANQLTFLGVFKTDSDGRVRLTLDPSELPGLGAYQIWMRVTGDNTTTHFMLNILRPQTPIAVFDIDGTLNHGELNWEPRIGAVETTHVNKDSGREVIYLSGRHYFLTRMTRNFLREHSFAEGSLIVGQSLQDVIPVDAGVGEYKTHYLKYLQGLGLVLERGYGDRKTDVHSYQEVQIPNDKIFILGENGGFNGTVALGEDFLGHLKELAQQPI